MKMIRISVCLVATALVLAGCTTPLGTPVRIPTKKTPEVMGIDDDLRIVKVGAPYTYVEKPDMDWSTARSVAVEVCKKRWGAIEAEPIGRTRHECLTELGSNCTRWAILGDYRCMTP